MDKYVIEGGNKLIGSVDVQSAKNSVLPLLAASILTDKRVTIREAPNISDVACMAQILRELGASVRFSGGNVTIDSANACCHEIPSSLTREYLSYAPIVFGIEITHALLSVSPSVNTENIARSYPAAPDVIT